MNTRNAPVPPHVCCYGEKSDRRGEGGEEWREGKGRDLCLSCCCRAACVRVRGGRGKGAGCVLYCSGVREYYCYALRHNEAL